MMGNASTKLILALFLGLLTLGAAQAEDQATGGPDDGAESQPDSGSAGSDDGGSDGGGSGDEGSGDDGSGDDGSGDDGSGNDGSGDDGSGDDGSGDDGSGDDGSGDDGWNDDGSGDDGSGEEGPGDEGTAEEGSGDEGTVEEGTVVGIGIVIDEDTEVGITGWPDQVYWSVGIVADGVDGPVPMETAVPRSNVSPAPNERGAVARRSPAERDGCAQTAAEAPACAP